MSKLIECRILMYSRQILQNKTAARRETAANKQEYKEKIYIYFEKKKDFQQCLLLMLFF